MPSENLVKIMLELEDKATEAAKKADDMIKKFGNSAQQSNQKASQSSQQLNNQMRSTNEKMLESARNVRKIGRDGQDSFKQLTSSQQDAAIKFNMLDKSAQNVLNHINEYGRSGMPGFAAAVENARNKFDSLNNVTNTFRGSLDYSRSKLQLLGTDTDTLKGKIQVVGSAIQTYLGTKWDGIKGKVTNLASHIKSSLTTALSTVKTKIQSLGDSFSGLGGVISSVFGGIGLAAMQQMTIGASINRERIQSLSYAMLGYGESFKSFSDGIWNQMDTMTNASLVSLDQLSQAASVVKMSTNASKEQMQNLLPVLNDIGQRAILMGKSGDEAMGLMQAAGKGLNGEFEMLRENFGITKEKLEDAGWSGSADDVDGYTNALKKCLSESGDINGMMDTTHGKITRLKKMWSVSARSLGDELKPAVDSALDSVLKFVDANNDGQIDEGGKKWMQYAVGAMSAASAFATIAPSITPVIQVLETMWNTASWVKDKLSNLSETIKSLREKWNTLKDAINNVKDKISNMGDSIQRLKDKFNSLKGSISTTKDKVVEFWSKLRENATDKLDLVKDKFNLVKDKIVLAKDKLVDFLGKVRAIAAEKISDLASKFKSLADGISLAGIKAKLYAAYQWLVNAATAVWNALLDANPVMIIVLAIMALIAVLIYLYNTNDTVKAAIDGLFAALSGVGEWIMDSLVPAFEWLWQTLQPIGEFLVGVFAPIWDIIVQVLTIVWTTITQITDAFNQFMTGQIDLPTLLLGIWGLLQQMWIQILVMIAQAVFNFAVQVLQGAIRAGTNMLNGVINYVSQLPGRVFNFLVQTTSRIIAAGVQWVASAKQKAMETVNGAVTNISQLPGKIYNEFAKIPGKIQEAAVQAIQAASQFGQMLIDAVLNAMGIHSPGIIQNSINDEFNNTVDKIKDTIRPAGEYAKQLGEEIVDKFGNPQLDLKTEDLLPYTDLDADKFENVDLNFDTSQFEDFDFGSMIDVSSISGGLDESVGLTEETNTYIGESYAALATMMMGTLNQMVLQDQLSYGAIQANDIATFTAINTSLNLNLLAMSTNLRIQLNNMVNTHRMAMMSAYNTTRQQLSMMLNETERVTAQMRSAWAVMADSIIAAAARIKNEATAYFDQLSSTIGSFYRKLQNPSQWAGGGSTGSPSTTRSAGRDPGVMTRITRGVANSIKRDNQLPYTISAVKASQSGLINPLSFEYMNISPSSRVNVLDLLQRGACPNCFSGGWEDVAPPNVAYIKATARQWSMKGPAIQTGVGPVDTGMAFHVYDFENGAPNISWSAFVQIADALAAAIPYDYYYNSDKYGSWQSALAHGAWNCFDGASAMVALANACGFSGYVDCGLNWGSDGHCAAIINGYTFDTTARRQRGGWTAGPCAYSHPAPSAGGGVNIKLPGRSSPPKTSNPWEGLFNDSEKSSENVNLNLNHNLTVTVDGNTENIDTNALISELTASVTDKRLIDKIADALIKRDKRIARMRGA